VAAAALRHDCTRRVYPGITDSLAPVGPRAGPNCSGAVQPGVCARYDPASFANLQWLQSARVYPNGTGVALVHNEMHGELSGNRTLCSHNGQPKGQPKSCVRWSTDLGASADGGASWSLAQKAVFTLPSRYARDCPTEGYGALGPILHDGAGNYYGHVSRSYENGTGSGTPGTTGSMGICAWRTRTPQDASSYRGWNGSAWSTRWENPYTRAGAPPGPDALRGLTCASIGTGGDGSSHPVVRRFAASERNEWRPAGWPAHVMFGWPNAPPGGLPKQTVSYAFGAGGSSASVGGAAPFTAWGPAQYLPIRDWVDPRVFGPHWQMRYPTLLDHDSPFDLVSPRARALAAAAAAAADVAATEEVADGLSYVLVGNRSLHLYFVATGSEGGSFIARLPVAWFDADAPTPTPPFVPPPAACNATAVRAARAVAVGGAGTASANGRYTRASGKTSDGAPVFVLDAAHQLYREGGVWRLGDPSVGVYYVGTSSGGGGDGPPGPGGWITGTLGVAPTPGSVKCA